MDCQHHTFECKCTVDRLAKQTGNDNIHKYTLDIQVKCKECGQQFTFNRGIHIAPDKQTAKLSIAPPLQPGETTPTQNTLTTPSPQPTVPTYPHQVTQLSAQPTPEAATPPPPTAPTTHP